MSIPKIKVCGVTREEDLQFLVDSGVDTVGINLVPSSKRYLSLDAALRLAKGAQDFGLTTVAVLMDSSASELAAIAQAHPWDFFQLHGNEDPEISYSCESISIIKSCSWSGRSEEEALIEKWSDFFGGAFNSDSNCVGKTKQRLAGFLLDSYAPAQGGGTGTVARWDLVYPRPRVLRNWPILLAGGLSPANVFDAIQQTRCDGVDTASGVELSPGIKSRELVTKFAREAIRSLEISGSSSN